MRKYFTLAFLAVLTISVSVAQDQVGDLVPLAEVPESIALVEQAKQYADGVVNANTNQVAELTHNDIIEIGGGIDFLLAELKADFESIKNQGLDYESSEVGNHPEFLNSGDELQTIIPVKFHLVMGDNKVESWVNLFAASTDKGVTWKFVNLEKFDEPSLREFVKNVSTELVYPTR